MLTVLAIVSGLSVFLLLFAINIMGRRLTRRVRLAAFESILYQDIGWFDVIELCQPGILSRLLTVDAFNIQSMVGPQFAVSTALAV